MRNLLIALFILLALPAQAARTLELKYSESEALNLPALAELKAKTEKAVAEEKALKEKRQELTRRNTAMTGDYTQATRSGAPGDIQKSAQEYREKFEQVNTEIREMNGKIPEAEKNATRLRRQLKIATWQARIDDPEYHVYLTDGMDWLQPLTSKDQAEKRLVLRDSEGKKYLFNPPPADPKAKKCGIWPADGEALALWQIGTEPPAEGKEIPVIKASHGQVYFLERADIPKECLYGKVVQKQAVK